MVNEQIGHERAPLHAAVDPTHVAALMQTKRNPSQGKQATLENS